MILDTIETVLKKKLDESQKENIKSTLVKSKLSRLSYNKTELSPKTDVEIQSEFSKLALSAETQKQNIASPLVVKNTEITPLKQIIKENISEAEIEEIIKSPKKNVEIKSPSSIFLDSLENFNLSPEEKKYLENQDKIRRKKFQDFQNSVVKKQEEKPNELYNALKTMKEQNRILKESISTPKVEKKYEKDTVDSVLIKDVTKIEKISPTREKELDTKEIQKIEQRLGSIVDHLKSMGQKCDSSEFKELFDSSFQENIKNYIEDIELVKSGGKNLNLLNQLESKYSKIAQDLNKKIEDEMQSKLKARQQQIEKEKQAKLEQELKQKKLELENKFLNEFKILESKLNDIKIIYSKLDSILSSKDIINQLLIESLTSKRNHVLNSIRNCTNEIEANLSQCKKYSMRSFLDSLDDKICYQVLSNLNDVNSKFLNQSQQFELQIKDIDSEIQKSINDLLKAKKDKEEAEKKLEEEKQKLKELELKKQAEEKQRLKEMEEKRIEEETRQRLEKEKALKEAQKKAQEQKEAQLTKVHNVDENNKRGINNMTLIEYEKILNSFTQLRKESEEALSAKEFKMYKFDLQKAINFPLNSLLEDKSSEENRRNFNEKIKTLVRLLTGQTCAITSTLTVNPTKHPKAIEFCLVYLARKLVEKGEETVASRPETSFQYCQVIIEILKNVKQFETILMGQFYEKCPYVIPYYKPRMNGQSDEQYFECLGYKIIDDVIEEDVHFYKRMSGVLYLYFTLILTANSQNQLSNLFTLKKAWQWLADILNMNPRANITAEMLAIFFKCCGFQLQQFYGKQFFKLVVLCSNDYLKLIKSIPIEKQSSASVGRLLNVFEQFKKNMLFPEWKKPN